MFVDQEDLSAVHPDSLEHPVAVEQPVIEDTDDGISFVDKFAADVDLGHGGKIQFASQTRPGNRRESGRLWVRKREDR